ncbi:AOC5 [Auxenochlorella protothecoides x Auxenochlorella symbiontica]|uniref:Cationic amino acid transporter C-terminal domain-containing protein n=1 Tax=Auxenochlorella protothecoides TaxID=3075 RepID=A0A1D1ZZA1_AUXPR
MASTLRLLRSRALVPRLAGPGPEASAEVPLRRCLTVWDLTFLGIGSMVGAGIFVITGVAAATVAGPAIILSYVLAALAAGLSALNYAELAASMPVAGSAFDYTYVVFGEGPAWSVGWSMVLETVLSSAAVARGLSGYAATLAGADARALLISIPALGLELDPLAAGLVLALSGLLIWSVKQGMLFNRVVSIAKLAAIALVLGMGLPRASLANLTPFAPEGVRGVFSGASLVFFSYVGFEMVANAAEEALEPSRDLPLAILGSLGLTTALYVAASACIVALVPRGKIDTHAAFSVAFTSAGLEWVARAVSAGALAGIITSCLCGLLAGARVLVTLGRAFLLPHALARVHPGRQTPVAASLAAAALAGTLSLLMDIGILAEVVSAGTLHVFLLVCMAVLHRRYRASGHGRAALRVVGGLCLLSLGASLAFRFGAPLAVLVVLAALWALGAASLCFIPRAQQVTTFQKSFSVPLFPITPALGLLVNIHLFCSLGVATQACFGAWTALGALIYCLYGVHAAAAAEEAGEAPLTRHESDFGDRLVPMARLDGSSEVVKGQASRLPQ